MVIPEIINSFNAYKAGNKLIGVTSEVSLAELTSITDTINGAGMLGEYEIAAIGHFSSIEQEIPFRMLEDDIFTLANPMDLQEITLRGSEQYTESSTAALGSKNIRIVFRGKQKAFKPGTMKQGAQMGASVTLEVVYIMIEVGGAQKLELDKLNSVYKINGVDLLAQIKKNC